MRNRSRKLCLTWEAMEPRALLSGVIAAMVTHPTVTGHGEQAATRGVPGPPQTQGPAPGATLFFQPTGVPTPKEVKRQTFEFTLSGPYRVGAGRFNNELLLVYIRGGAKSNFFFHGDGQIGLVVPTDPNTLISGQATFFDRNINANSVFGLDLAGNPTDLDSHGRPTQLTLSTDVNISSGIFVESLSQGTVQIKYVSNGKHTPGIIDQGTAFVKVKGTAYTLGTANLLTNTDLNP